LLLLNTMGYYGIFLGLQHKNDVAMIHRLDNGNYDNSNTITIKIPVAVPYANDDQEFHRVDGKFEYQGKFFRLVKQQYANDTLTVVCLKDSQDTKLNQALTNYVNSFAAQSGEQKSSSKFTIDFIKDYIPQNFAVQNVSLGWNIDLTQESFYGNLIPSYFSSIVHPPERISYC
jgi:hypothetical protein